MVELKKFIFTFLLLSSVSSWLCASYGEERTVVRADVVHCDSQTGEQMARRARANMLQQQASNEPIVKAAQDGKLNKVKTICENVPGKGCPAYTFLAIVAAVGHKHYHIAEYLLFRQPACRHNRELCYSMFWNAIWVGEKKVFDYCLDQGIDVHHISSIRWKLNAIDGTVMYNNVYVNAISFLRAGFFEFGYLPELGHIKRKLERHGLTDAPGLNYEPEGGGCCEVF
jgi:hypothetical protein